MIIMTCLKLCDSLGVNDSSVGLKKRADELKKIVSLFI